MAEMLQGKPLFKGRDRILTWSPCNSKGTKLIPNYFSAAKPLHPPWCSDLDQLTEIMKITGTPSQELIGKLDSEDVSAGEIYCDAKSEEMRFVCFNWLKFSFVCGSRLKATSKVSRKWKRKTFTLWFLSLIPRVGITQPHDDMYNVAHWNVFSSSYISVWIWGNA